MSHNANDDVLRAWQERDLSEAARLGQLPKAFHVEPLLRQIGDVLTSGRFPILCGESGVGKTAHRRDDGLDLPAGPERLQRPVLVLDSFPAPGPQPLGLTFDGETLWVSDFTDQALYRLSP